METVYNVLIIGAGRIGAFYDQPGGAAVLTHAHAVTRLPGFRLAGFVDIDADKAEQAAGLWGGQAFESLGDAFGRCTIDVACVSTPDDAHTAVLQDLAQYPIRLVLAEKPLVAKITEADRILSLYQQTEIPLAINYIRRFVPAFRHLTLEIRQGKFGRFLGGQGLYGKGLLHNGSHLLDLATQWLGPLRPERVLETLEDYVAEDPTLTATLRNPEGALFFLRGVDCRLYTVFELDLLFERGRVRVLGGGQTVERYDIVPYPLTTGYQVLKKTETIQTGLESGLLSVFENIASHLAGRDALHCTGQEAREVLRLCQEIQALPDPPAVPARAL